jgi:L-asparagine transporter-like permease
MEQVTKLLEQLAIKLGTTVEYLWGILNKQATVQLQINQIWMTWEMWIGIAAIIFFVLIIIGMIFAKDEREISAAMGWLAFCIFVVIITVGVCYYGNYTQNITLKTNPEYWALNEILNRLGK